MGNELTTREVVRLRVAYSSAIILLLFILLGAYIELFPAWVVDLCFVSVVICALGMASWLAYSKKEQILQRWHWAPLAPNGPYYNPVLFSLGDRSVSLQGQIPSLLMTPLFYWLSNKIHTRHKIRVSQISQND